MDLYDQEVDVRFMAYLRSEERFDGVDSLVAQIGRDIEQARAVLGVPQT